MMIGLELNWVFILKTQPEKPANSLALSRHCCVRSRTLGMNKYDMVCNRKFHEVPENSSKNTDDTCYISYRNYTYNSKDLQIRFLVIVQISTFSNFTLYHYYIIASFTSSLFIHRFLSTYLSNSFVIFANKPPWSSRVFLASSTVISRLWRI